MITTNKETLSQDDIYEIFKAYISSPEYTYICNLSRYYNSDNPELAKVINRKRNERKQPNWSIPTAYYSTLVDSLAGYQFSNVTYSEVKHNVDAEGNELLDESKQGEFAAILNKTFADINIDVVDLQTGTRAVAYNKAVELVYTIGNGDSPAQIRTVSLDPKSVITIYYDEIEPVLTHAILFNTVNYKAGDKTIVRDLTVISKDLIDYYRITEKQEIIPNTDKEPIPLVWAECPVIEYKTEVLNNNSCFHQVLPYIDALDCLITGNSNEVDKLADAILKLSANLSDEQKKNLNELRVIEGLNKEDIAEYITRTTDSSFREYVSKLLIQEIHKHAHIIDFYSPDGGAVGDASGKALKTRLVDMNMFCDRISKSVKLGWQKRIRLYKDFFLKDKRISEYAANTNIKINFNRTPIVGVEDIAASLANVTFISDETKQELCGLDSAQEQKRLEEQKNNSGFDVTDLITQKNKDTTSDELERTPTTDI